MVLALAWVYAINTSMAVYACLSFLDVSQLLDQTAAGSSITFRGVFRVVCKVFELPLLAVVNGVVDSMVSQKVLPR